MSDRLIFWITQLLQARSKERYYGTITFHLQAGRVTLVTTSQTHKPPEDA